MSTNVIMKVDEHESIEFVLKKFKKKCDRDGIVKEIKERRYFKKPSLEKKLEREKRERKERRKSHKDNERARQYESKSRHGGERYNPRDRSDRPQTSSNNLDAPKVHNT